MSQILKVNSNTDAVLAKARKVLCTGGVIAFPTDTFYALGVNPFNVEAVNRLFELKNRESNKPLILLINSKTQLESLVKEINPAHSALMQRFWPGPLTLLFEPRSIIPKNVLAGSKKIAIRHPGNSIAVNLISALGQPITAPSANFSGEPPPVTAIQVQHSFGNKVDLILDGGACQGGEPSTLIDAVETPVRIVRQGAILFSEIKKSLHNLTPLASSEVRG
jgi:L-threonylcarbamoyladenylate synthase